MARSLSSHDYTSKHPSNLVSWYPAAMGKVKDTKTAGPHYSISSSRNNQTNHQCIEPFWYKIGVILGACFCIPDQLMNIAQVIRHERQAGSGYRSTLVLSLEHQNWYPSVNPAGSSNLV